MREPSTVLERKWNLETWEEMNRIGYDTGGVDLGSVPCM